MAASSGSIAKRVLSVYGYTDYRKYLADYYRFRKDSERGYSYRAFSKGAGFTSPNFLKLLIDGERNVSNDAIEKLIQALNLEEQMADYFRALVKMNQAKDDAEKEQWFAELRRLIPHAKKRMLDSEAHRYLSHWLYPAIREMIQLSDFREDPYWIARRLNGDAAPGEIAQALTFLVEQGFLSRDANGKLAASENMVMSSDEVKSLAVRNYHRQMMDRAKDCLEALPISEREFGALTFVLPESAREELKYRLKSFLNELHGWAVEVAQQKDQVDSVVQLNVQMFPHTRKA